MPSTPDDETDRDDRPPDTPEDDGDGEPNVVFEFAIPCKAFALEDALAEFPDLFVEGELFVPTTDRPMPFLWASEGSREGFEDVVAEDPDVERVRQVFRFDSGLLLDVDWRRTDGGLLRWLASNQETATLLQASGHDDEWTLKLRFPSREALTDFQSFLADRELSYRVVRLFDLTDPKLGQYNMTSKQRTALLKALEMGYFRIPREATLGEVGDALGISPKSTSERLRRGQTNLVSNTVQIGRPTGVGLPGR